MKSFKLSKSEGGNKWGWILFFIFIFVLGTILLGNTNSNDYSSEDRNAESAEETRCLEVSENVIDWIESELTVNGGGYLRNAKAVKSNDFENVYFVSADLQGSGIEGDDEIAIFATNSITDEAMVLAVDGIAQEFSSWFHGDREGAQYNVTMFDDGAYESRDCVENSQ